MDKIIAFLRSLWKAWRERSLVLRISVGLIMGALLGLFCPQQTWVALFGKIFVSALKSVAPVLVFVLVVSALANVKGGMRGRFRILIFRYIFTTIIAAVIAIAASMLFPVTLQLSEAAEMQPPAQSIGSLFENLITSIAGNPIAALANANYLCILFWALLLGVAFNQMASVRAKEVLSDISYAVSQCVKWIISLAPLGIMGLVFSSVADKGLDIFATYGQLLMLLVGVMMFCTFVTNPIIVSIIIRRNPYPLLFTCLKESGLQAFFTRSSAANIPINMQLCEKMGVDRNFYSVAVPLGSTINMDGAAVTITVMTLAACHTLGIEVGMLQAILLCLMSTAAACGASGVAGGSLLLIPMACSMFGIGNDIAMEVVAVGFIIGVVQDSVETALNSSNDALYIIATDIYERQKAPADSQPPSAHQEDIQYPFS